MSIKNTPIIETTTVKTDLRKKEPPLINLQVSNPVTYLKSWWNRVIGGEGVDLRFKIQPLTAIAMTVVIATIGFGVGRITISSTKPYIQLISNTNSQIMPPTPMPTNSPAPAIDPWRATAFSGILKYSTIDSRYYLITTSSEAITLVVPENVDLSSLIARRIFATGKYNESTRTLEVSDASDLEVLPKKIESVPVVEESPEPVL